MAAHYSGAPLFVTTDGRAGEINGAVVSSNFFPLLGLTPAHGRFFGPEEDRVPDRDLVVVLSHDLWRDWFGARPDALGEAMTINGRSFTIIGVAPASFSGLGGSPSMVYMPTMTLSTGYRWCPDALAEDCTILSMIGRLAEGGTLEQTRAEFATLLPFRWTQASTDENSGVAVFHPRGIDRPYTDLRLVTLLTAVAGVLLLVCCANLAGLMIARGGQRARELAIRTSLGATGLRLMRQLLTESTLLAVIGAGLGVWLSMGLTRMLEVKFYATDYAGRPLNVDLSLRPGVTLAVFGVAVLAGLIFGGLPALKSIRVGVAESIKRQTTTISTRSRLGPWLLGGQVALAVALIAMAALFSVSAARVVGGTSFESSHVALLRLRPRQVGYPPERAQQFTRDVVRQLESLPGVESVGFVGEGGVVQGFETTVYLPGQDAQSGMPARYTEVGPRYFETLQIPLLGGREFDDRDTTGAPPVAIVSESLARRLWPGAEVTGRSLTVGGSGYEVVGVVKDLPPWNRSDSAHAARVSGLLAGAPSR